MASEQVSRRENITTERKIPGEKDNVQKTTTRIEKELPQGGVEPLPGGEINKDRSGKAIGDIAGRGKARQSHELGPNVQSLPDRNENPNYLDRAGVPVSANVAENRVGENAPREKLDNRTRVVSGTPHIKEQNRALGKEQVVAERGRVHGAENQDAILEKSVSEEKERARERAKDAILEKNVAEEKERARERAKDAILEKNVAEEKERARERAKEATKETLNNTARAAQEKGAQAAEKAAQAKEVAAEKAAQAKEVAAEKAAQAKEVAAEKAAQAKDVAAEKGQQGYEATKDTVSNAAKIAAEKAAQAKDTAAEKAAQAKDVAAEKGQQGYEATKGTVSNAAKTAAEKAAQAKNLTLEKTQQGYEATKDTVSNAAKTAADYATPVAEKTKTAAEKAKCAAVQAKDVTVEKGKTAAEIAGKVVSAAGWTATHYATQLTVDGTKAAANVVEGAVGYVAPKASELAAKSVETVKGLAASAGETAKEFTARKKDESWREYEAQKASQPKEGEEISPSSEGENVSNYRENLVTQKVIPSEERIQAEGTNLQEKGIGSNVIPTTGETETVENILEKEQGKGSEKREKKNEEGSDENITIAVTETK
ncbi:unnamed protein product [Lathyrus sativus]|nr:unnamed protein product [Lathyrus sativus]